MNKYEIIKVLREKENITTKELNELGFDSHKISKLIDSEFISRKERGVYTYGSIKSLLDYGNELLDAKDKENSKLIFDFCYGVAPDNYDVNVNELYLSILLGNNEEVFKYFNFVYSTLKEKGRMNDAYYYMFLYSYCFDVPNRYLIDYMHFLNGDFRRDDADKYNIRENVYTIDFGNAKKEISNSKLSFDNEYEGKLENAFVCRAYNVYYYRNNYIKQCIENGNYDRAKSYLESRDKEELLSYSQKSLLYLIKVYCHVCNTNEIPQKKEIGDINNFYSCIEYNQFELAKKLLDDYYSTHPNKNSSSFYLVLEQLVKLINDINDKKRKKEMLNLDNIISMIIDGDYSLVDEYLTSINKGEYSFLIKDFIKLAELNNKNNYFVITTLISIVTGEYKFNINNFVSLYLNALQNKDFDKAKVFLDIISKSSHISSIDIEKSMMKIFTATVTNKSIDVETKTQDNVIEINNVVDTTDDEDAIDEPVFEEENNSSEEINYYDVEEGSKNFKDSFEEKIRNILDLLNEDNPINLLPAVSSEDEMDRIFEIIENGYPSIKAFVINTPEGSQAVVRYNAEIEEFIDFRELCNSAKTDFLKHNYHDALSKYRQLLTVGKPHPGIYGAYGICLRNIGRKEEAITALKIATGYSKLRDGSLDYSGIIFDLTHPTYKDPEYEKKPFVDMKNYDPDNSSFGIEMPFLDDLIQLVKEGEFSFDDAIEKLNLSEEDKNYARLIYARDCYYVASYELGDRYFKMVEKSKNKNEKVLSLLDEIRRNKRFYQNRLDEEKRQLVLIK